MADFSKEWCEKNDSQMPYDFSIKEVFDSLEPDHYKVYICEGYGFWGIGKTKDSKCFLVFTDPEDENLSVDIPLEELDEYSNKRYGY